LPRDLMTLPGGEKVREAMPYSGKFKEKMLSKLTGPDAMSATALSKEVDVAQATLSRWLREAKVLPIMSNGGGKKAGVPRKRWSPEEKVRVVMEAAAAGAEGLGALLRREGLHEADLERFRKEVEEAATEGLRAKGRRRGGPSPEQKRTRRLEKELARKERALAEAAALLVLRKKAEAFFLSEEEGDDTDGSNDR
jgi:transposase